MDMNLSGDRTWLSSARSARSAVACWSGTRRGVSIYPIANRAKNRTEFLSAKAKLRESAKAGGRRVRTTKDTKYNEKRRRRQGRGPETPGQKASEALRWAACRKPHLAIHLRPPNDSLPLPSCQGTGRTTLARTRLGGRSRFSPFL